MSGVCEGAEVGVHGWRRDAQRSQALGLDERVQAVYTGVGKVLSRYTTGKLPKAFKIIPNLTNWEEVRPPAGSMWQSPH